jgi:hypothetical protein
MTMARPPRGAPVDVMIAAQCPEVTVVEFRSVWHRPEYERR